MANELTLHVISAEHLSPVQKADIASLCSAAYGEEFDDYLEMLSGPVHVLARLSENLVSHAAWVTRWLQVDDGKLLRTAYVEAVATAPAYQGRGLASAVMRELVRHLEDYDLGALSPSDAMFYERLGWEVWHGPLAVRTKDGLQPTPDEQVMIYRLARTPSLDSSRLLTAEWREGEVW
jgi:aminoglycoside 2'-N-acetyltransferase I